MDPAELFRANASLIDRITDGVCRRARVTGADAEDFAGDVRLALMEGDFAILREFEGRASLAGYLSIVIERLMFDHRTRTLGRWMPSAIAKRLGDAAMLLEKLLQRDHRSLDEAVPFMRAAHPELVREELARIAAELPPRTSRPRAVPLDEVVADTVPASDSAEDRAMTHDAEKIAARASEVMRQELGSLPTEDRMIIRFRFGASMSIADISRVTRLPQRPLYRRIESLLARLRRALTAAAIDSASLAEIIGMTGEMNFGLTETENGAAMQSTTSEEAP
jgi:RNA polymerase sigma factor (sigma-70 family)